MVFAPVTDRQTDKQTNNHLFRKALLSVDGSMFTWILVEIRTQKSGLPDETFEKGRY